MSDSVETPLGVNPPAPSNELRVNTTEPPSTQAPSQATNIIAQSTAATTSSLKRKWPSNASTVTGARQQKLQSRIEAFEAILDAAEMVPPTLMAPNIPAPTARLSNPSCANDVYWHMAPASSRDNVPVDQIELQIKQDEERQAAIPIEAAQHVDAKFYRCVPCLARGITKAYVNGSGGVTNVLRKHLQKVHPALYYAKCLEAGLMERLHKAGISPQVQPEFTRAGLTERLVKWMAVDDQALNVVECPEFRDVLLYCGQNKLKNEDIPHRDKLAKAAWAMYLLEKSKIDEEMKGACGLISLTSDLWSDTNLRSFMSVTVHYIYKDKKQKGRLIAFRKIDGQHTGANIGQALMDVLIEFGIAEKVGCITLDNASNNNKLMDELVKNFEARGWPFDANENRIRCFPHVMNLAVQAILKALPSASAAFRDSMASENELIDDESEEYLKALDSDPVEACRASIAACRSSGQRREGLRKVILDGNALGRFRLPNGEVYVIPAIELLRDTPIRWSSTYTMIKRHNDLYPESLSFYLAITEFVFRNRDTQIPFVSHKQYQVFQHLTTVLGIAHSAQELLSAERTPTLSLAFPVYESVVQAWLSLCNELPILATAIGRGIAKIREYINRTQSARIHTLAMVINPALKFEWFNQFWAAYDRQGAYETVREEMLRHQRQRHSHAITLRHSATHSAALAQNLGYLQVLSLGQTPHRGPESSVANSHKSPTNERLEPPTDALPLYAHARLAPTPAEIEAHNLGAVEFELNQYIAKGTIPIESMGAIDLVEFWRVHEFTYPLLHCIAMDVLPVQASSASSERVFSSSKMTCTAERSRLSVKTMEALQVLKHTLKHRRRELSEPEASLDFVSHVFEALELED